MKKTQKRNKKRTGKRLKKALFSVIVILVILSFAASFFASGIKFNKASAAQQQATAYPTPTSVSMPSSSATPTPSPTVNMSDFLATIKALMVVSEDPAQNATLIVGAVNVYNKLYPDDIIVVDQAADATVIEKLKGADIYFDDITEDAAADAWKLVTVDDNGVASVKE
ncbi:MAG: hypothetical protein AB1Z19_05540 [Eubacteriales bacterium]